MQIDNRGALDDVISGMKRAGKYDLWLRDGNELVTARPGGTIGVVAELPYDIPIDDCKLDFDGLKKALSTLDSDTIELTVNDDGSTVTLSDGNREIAIRVHEFRRGPSPDPAEVDTGIADTVLDVPYDAVAAEVKDGVKIVDSDAIFLDADDTTLHISCASGQKSYDVDLDLDRSVTPTSSTYDANLLKAIEPLAAEADRVAFSEDAPLIAEGAIGDIDFVVLLAPRVEED